MMARAMATRRRIPPESSAGESGDGVLQFDEAQGLQHALMDFVGDLPGLFDQAIGDVFLHRQRIEERALLKYHADVAPQLEQVLLAHGVISSSSTVMRPESGFSNPSASFRIRVFPVPATPIRILVSPRGS